MGVGAVAVLSGCGFALRGEPSFPFTHLSVTGLAGGEVTRALRQTLGSAGLQTAEGLAVPEGTDPRARAVLVVLVDQTERAVVGQTADGRVRELQLRTRYRFRLEEASGRILVDNTELLMERDLSYSETEALSKAAEEDLSFREMRADIVQQVLRRLSAARLN
ncbi:MAG TPA: LPS assembly lipoprotein LptE [Hydrogenophaga sp.]|uniref:LPS-assembly lipoprotein LptE n=1 Tax=Hydrogenophaga sp. TaxID=1904254 RepID=UPI002C95AEB6|nr:LPS assembly lipoprotein LptE [Hydrogenophaga sp.]HMN94720.1 LPS assembly lipoprotein LptE [Hydrogenophaga sp.]HMP11944.1 LPS assembly lipoprotein LptE [Hydrogenophaga sp.]